MTHGDFHHHNILRHGDRFVAIDPKPYLGDREYDLFSFLRNPIALRMTDREQTERRIAAFVAAGLDDYKIRAWTVIRGAYLGLEPDGGSRRAFAPGLEEQLDPHRLAVAVDVRLGAGTALPLRQEDPAQVGELDRDGGADGGEELGVPHTGEHRHSLPDRQ